MDRNEKNENAFEKLDLEVATDNEQRKNCWEKITSPTQAHGAIRGFSCLTFP